MNKEYKTPLERRLILGLISRDYNLHEIEDKAILGQNDETPQGNFTSQIPLESFAMEESINAIMEEEQDASYNSNSGLRQSRIGEILKDKKF